MTLDPRSLWQWICCLGITSLAVASRVAVQEPFNAGSAATKPALAHDLIGFLKNLTEIESISGNEKAVGEWLASSLESQGYRVEKQTVEEDPLRFNVLAWPGSTRDAEVLISSHIDTVPPFYPYKHHNRTLTGRGTVDDKGSIAAQIVAVNSLLASGDIDADDVAFLFVVGEEVGGEGMRKANDYKLHPKTVLFGEPTEGKLVAGHKGTSQVLVKAKGKAAHSGYPWLGRSANEVLISALTPLIGLGEKLPKSDKYGTTTINIGKIVGGVAGNVIAESANATITVRIAEGTPDFIYDAITKAVHHGVRDFLEGEMEPQDVVELSFPSKGYGPIDIDYDIPGFDVITVNYGTDIPWLKKAVKDQKRYLYGPGSILVAHSDHEAITEDELWEAVNGYQRIILHVLGKTKHESSDL